MKILVISDIHANLTALQAVLQDAADQYESVWCLGDLVGYGPDPNECIEVIHALPNLTCLVGNHDAAALGKIDLDAFNRDARLSVEWMKTNLNEASLLFLQSLPERVEVENVTMAHGSPRNPVWEYLLDTRVAGINFFHFTTPVCLVGHTHLPIAYLKADEQDEVEWRLLRPETKLQVNSRAILNPGSVGQPRDHDPRAAYALFDTTTLLWEPHRVEYDIPSVQKRIEEAGLPRRHAMRLSEGW